MKSWQQVFKEESERRLNLDINKLCRYGVAPLDDALDCIMPNDLVVIGADSGAGKSDLGLKIAANNAKSGKKVAVFYLEGGEYEAMARIKWTDICEEYYKNYTNEHIDMDYKKWVTNQIKNKCITEIESKVWGKYQNMYKNNLDLFPVKSGFTFNDFYLELMDYSKLEKNIIAGKVHFEIDLIIIDHLQYFNLPEGETEITQITKILREVKTLSDNYDIPVILISHLRKKGKDRGLPDQEDFYGSSNIPKISTTSIIISKDTKNESFDNLMPTYFRIVKSRVGVQSNYCARINYNLIKREYEKEYTLHFVNERGVVKDDPINYINMPKWAKEGGVKHETNEEPQRINWDD